VDPEWLAEIEDENVGFNQQLTPSYNFSIVSDNRQVDGSLNHVDITELIQALQKLWDHVEAPATV
jgi:hypothetical protein